MEGLTIPNAFYVSQAIYHFTVISLNGFDYSIN